MSHRAARLVVVDGDPTSLKATSHELRTAGWTVLEAATGQDALARAGEADLMVLKIPLPDMEGFEACRRLRGDRPTGSLPVIVLSESFAESGNQPELPPCADAYLTHPVGPPALAATVKALLSARQAERDLRETEAKFRAAFNAAKNGMALLDDQLQCTDANPALCRLLEQSRDRVVGRSLGELSSAEEEAVAKLQEQLTREGSWSERLSRRRANGDLQQLEWSISPASPDGYVLVVVDVTDRLQFEHERRQLLERERAARAEAERADRLKDDFLATLSHELRTPLNAIVGWSELLKLGRLEDEEMREGIDAIDRNAKTQAQMISDLLDVSRITSGRLRLEMQTVDPAATIAAALAVVEPSAEAKGVEVSTALDDHAGPVTADPARLQQVVWNLVSNAVKFTPPGGRIRVTLRRLGSTVEIAVEDSGQGIAPGLLPHLFRRFHQGDQATTRRYGGLGLGLAIVRQLVEMHGGTVRVDSPGAGQGATFTISLPVASVRSTLDTADPEASHAPTVDGQNGSSTLEGVRVMIVDDDADARRLTRKVLAESGAESQEAADVEAAVAAIPEFSPHVLISDLGMPDHDGFELIREVRSRGYTFHDLPAVALTAFARTEDRRRALLAGFQVHLAKPVDPSELTAVIATLVGRTGGG
ncbi:MAG: response regulator [Pirellulales bacterium]|nr:response regulator [Pirellulales bacterium]